jgi:hypothetical protein
VSRGRGGGKKGRKGERETLSDLDVLFADPPSLPPRAPFLASGTSVAQVTAEPLPPTKARTHLDALQRTSRCSIASPIAAR